MMTFTSRLVNYCYLGGIWGRYGTVEKGNKIRVLKFGNITSFSNWSVAKFPVQAWIKKFELR